MQFNVHKCDKTKDVVIIEGVSDLNPWMNVSIMVATKDYRMAKACLELADKDYWETEELHDWEYTNVLCVALEEMGITYMLFSDHDHDEEEVGN